MWWQVVSGRGGEAAVTVSRVVDSAERGDAAGSLLSILSVCVRSMGQFLSFKCGEDLCRKLVVAIAV